jgi:hypothetical protein
MMRSIRVFYNNIIILLLQHHNELSVVSNGVPAYLYGHLTLLLLWNSAARQVNSNERNTIK